MKAEAFAQVPNLMTGDVNLTDAEYRVYAILLGHDYGKKTVSWPSQVTIAAIWGKGTAAVGNAVRGLEDKGYVRIVRVSRNSTNRYYLVPQTQVETAAALANLTDRIQSRDLVKRALAVEAAKASA